MKRKVLCMLLVVMLSGAMLAGCGNNNDIPDKEVLAQSDETDTQPQETDEPETQEPTETPTEEPTEQPAPPTEEPTTPQTEEVTPEPTEEVPPQPQFTFTDLEQVMYAKSSVNVRDLPNTDGEKLGGLSRAQEVAVTGQCNETSWYRITYNGSEAFVSDSYLINEKPSEEVVTQSSSKNFEYELYKVYDYGDYALFYYVFNDDGTRNRDLESQAHDELFRITDGRGWEKCIVYPDVIGTYAEGKIWSRTLMSEERHMEVYGTGYPDMSQY